MGHIYCYRKSQLVTISLQSRNEERCFPLSYPNACTISFSSERFKNCKKRSHDGKLIKERTTTCNVPNSNDRGNKRSRIPVNPEDDVPEAVMNEREKWDFINNILTLKKEMLSKQQLTKLLSVVIEKKTGNKQVLLERLQLYYSRVATANDAEAVAATPATATACKNTLPTVAVVAVAKTASAANAADGKTAPGAAKTAGGKRVQVAVAADAKTAIAAIAANAAGRETALAAATIACGKRVQADVVAVGKAGRSGSVKPVGRGKTASVATPSITAEEMKTAPVVTAVVGGNKKTCYNIRSSLSSSACSYS